jgi:hypothetical protein
MDITKNSIEKNIKIPNLLLLVNPYAIISTEKEELILDNFLNKEDKEIFLTFDIIKNEIINLKFQDLLLDSNNNNNNFDMEIFRTLNGNINSNTNLNFITNSSLFNDDNNNSKNSKRNNNSNSNNNDNDNILNEDLITRLNFTENLNTEIFNKFPYVYLIIPQNEIFKENSLKLFEFMK